MTMITPSYLGETIEYSSLHACRSTLEDPTIAAATEASPTVSRPQNVQARNTQNLPGKLEWVTRQILRRGEGFILIEGGG